MGYKELFDYIEGKPFVDERTISLNDAVEEIKKTQALCKKADDVCYKKLNLPMLVQEFTGDRNKNF